MSLKEHTRITLESGGKLSKVGVIVVDALNEIARAHEAGEPLPNHTPSSPAFWFSGLAREHGGRSYGGQFENDAPIASALIRSNLSDAAIVLARRVLACRCDERWGSWEMSPHSHDWEDGAPFACYPCSFDAHGMCHHGCKADQDVLMALDDELKSRGLPTYERPRFDALARDDEEVAA